MDFDEFEDFWTDVTALNEDNFEAESKFLLEFLLRFVIGHLDFLTTEQRSNLLDLINSNQSDQIPNLNSGLSFLEGQDFVSLNELIEEFNPEGMIALVEDYYTNLERDNIHTFDEAISTLSQDYHLTPDYSVAVLKTMGYIRTDIKEHSIRNMNSMEYRNTLWFRAVAFKIKSFEKKSSVDESSPDRKVCEMFIVKLNAELICMFKENDFSKTQTIRLFEKLVNDCKPSDMRVFRTHLLSDILSKGDIRYIDWIKFNFNNSKISQLLDIS